VTTVFMARIVTDLIWLYRGMLGDDDNDEVSNWHLGERKRGDGGQGAGDGKSIISLVTRSRGSPKAYGSRSPAPVARLLLIGRVPSVDHRRDEVSVGFKIDRAGDVVERVTGNQAAVGGAGVCLRVGDTIDHGRY